MAAAEYFSSAPMNQASQPYHQHQQQQQQPPPPYQSPQLQPVPQIQTPPQQYAPNNNSVHFAPSPADVHQRHSFSGQQRPSFSQSHSSWNQPPSSNPYQQQNQQLAIHHPPQQFSSPHSSGYNSPQQRAQHLAPHMRPYANPNSSQFSLDHGYSSDPEPHRRKHKQKKRRESDTKTSRSSNKDAFLGAAGGGLIGDLIFPGLGTVGGAAIGYFGGKDYAKHRKVREEERHAAQKEWEARHGHDRHHRDESRDYTSKRRDSSEYRGNRSRTASYDRRQDDRY